MKIWTRGPVRAGRGLRKKPFVQSFVVIVPETDNTVAFIACKNIHSSIRQPLL